METKTRYAPGAELFVPESLMEGFADLGDGAYDSESSSSGFILGTRFSDTRGVWTELTGISGDESLTGAVGWFRTSEGNGLEMSAADVRRHRELFGKERAYAVMMDPSASSLVFYTVEDDVPVRVRAMVMEGR